MRMEKIVENIMKKYMLSNEREDEILSLFKTDGFLWIEKRITTFKMKKIDAFVDYQDAVHLFENNQFAEAFEILRPLVKKCNYAAIYLAYKLIDEHDELKEDASATFIKEMYQVLCAFYKMNIHHMHVDANDFVQNPQLSDKEKKVYFQFRLMNYYTRIEDNGDELLKGALICTQSIRLFWLYLAACKGNIASRYLLARAYEKVEDYDFAFLWCTRIVHTTLSSEKENYFKLKKRVEKLDSIKEVLQYA